MIRPAVLSMPCCGVLPCLSRDLPCMLCYGTMRCRPYSWPEMLMVSHGHHGYMYICVRCRSALRFSDFSTTFVLLQPLKRSRGNGAAELSCGDATLPLPQSLQRCVAANGFPAHSAALCMRNLQGLANQGQASMAAIQERVSLWKQQGASTEGVRAERSPFGFVATPRHSDQVSSIQAELQLRQQHAARHLSGCSPQASSYSAVHQDRNSRWSSHSTSMEQGYTSRDPRQDARGGKRLCITPSTSASPVFPGPCFASTAPSPNMTRGDFMAHLECIEMSSVNMQAHLCHESMYRYC